MKIDPSIFRAYDVRGIYPRTLDEKVVYAITQAYVKVFKPKLVVVTRDPREHGPQLKRSVIKSFRDSGVNVLDGGTVSTEVFYFAVGHLKTDGGITVSASHNPREWNGLNMAKKNAQPISGETGLQEIGKLACKGARVRSARRGSYQKVDLLKPYIDFILKQVDILGIKPLTIVANPNHGLQGEVLEKIIQKARLPIKLEKIYFNPDGTFPQGHPNPLLPENRRATLKLVRDAKADLGVSWDADGDRCFLVDEKGRFIEGYFMTALLASEILKKNKGKTVIIDPRLTWASLDAIKRAGGKAVISRAGMTIIAERMRREKAVFAGEMSAHFYFPQTFNRDNGMLPLLLILQMMKETGKKLSQFFDPYFKKYFISGEINNEVENPDEIIGRVEEKYSDGKIEHIDGLSVEFENWRFNLRKSNTEPLLRLNVEASSRKLMEEKRDDLLAIIRQKV